MYVIMYGMKRTTVYLPDELKNSLESVARAEGRSEAELIREGVKKIVNLHVVQMPRIPLFKSTDPTLAERVDESLKGFGGH